MKKIIGISLSAVLLFIQTSYTQSWFSLSSNWYNNYNNFSIEGYAQLSYESDTTIQGIACQKFSLDQVVHDYIDGNNYNYSRPPIFFTETNDVVQLYMDGGFQTIIDMNTEIGESWTFEFQSELQNFDLVEVQVEVQDKDNITLNGSILKRMAVYYTYSYRSFGQGDLMTMTLTDTLIERVGNNKMFIDPREFIYEILDAHSASSLRCYSDQEIGIYEYNSPQACDFVVSTSTLQTRTEVRFAPNPTSDQVIIDAASPVQQVDCYTMQGQFIRNLSSQGMCFSLSGLPAGVYWLRIAFANGERGFYSIVKK